MDDDPELLDLIAHELRMAGFLTRCASNGQVLFNLIEQQPVDLVLLDLMLPGEDGLELCRRLKQLTPAPAVIMVTARGSLTDRVVGLELGADDYVVKPFESRELVARCRAVLRRPNIDNKAVTEPERHTYQFLGWTLEVSTRQLHDPKGVMVALANSDFHILHALLQAPNRPHSREELLQKAFGRPLEYEDRAVDVCISRLRNILESDRKKPQLIHTVRNEGYMLTLDQKALQA